MRLALPLAALIACSPAKAKDVAPPPTTAPKVEASAATHARRPPTLPAAAFTWAVAEASNSADVWTSVADSLAAELATCTTDCREAAYEVVLARNNAVAVASPPPPHSDDWTPVPLPPEVEVAIAAQDAYAASLPPTDDEVAPMQFLSAAALWRYQQDAAIPRLEALLREHRDDETAEYAANQLLDALMRAGRIADLHAWAAELSADETFLADKPDLRETLAQVVATLASAD